MWFSVYRPWGWVGRWFGNTPNIGDKISVGNNIYWVEKVSESTIYVD